MIIDIHIIYGQLKAFKTRVSNDQNYMTISQF